MKIKIQVAVKFIFAITLLSRQAFLANPTKGDSHSLDALISDVTFLIHLVSGISIQSHLPNQFKPITMELLRMDSNQLTSFLTVDIEELSKKIEEVQVKSEKVEISPFFDILLEYIDSLAPLMSYSHIIENGITMRMIEEFSNAFENLQQSVRDQKIAMMGVDVNSFIDAINCIDKDIPLNKTKFCLKVFRNSINDLNLLSNAMENLEKNQTEVEIVSYVLEKFEAIEGLSAVVNGVFSISNGPMDIRLFDTIMDVIRSDMTKANEMLTSIGNNEYSDKLEILFKLEQFNSTRNFLKGIPEGITDLAGIFENLEKKSKLIGNSTKSLKIGLSSFKSYTEALVEIQEIMKNQMEIGKTNKNVEEIVKLLKKIEELRSNGMKNGQFYFPPSFIEPFKSCLTDTPKYPKDLNIMNFRKEFEDNFKTINLLKIFFRCVKEMKNHVDIIQLAIKSIQNLIFSQLENIKDDVKEEVLKDCFIKIYTVFIESKGSEDVRQLKTITNTLIQSLQSTVTNDLKKRILDGVKLEMTSEAVRLMTDSSVYPLIKCARIHEKKYNQILKIFKGVESTIQMAKSQEAVNETIQVLKHASEIQKMLKSAKQIFSSNNSNLTTIEARKVNEFGKKQDLTTSFLDGTKAIKEIMKVTSKGETFQLMLNSPINLSMGTFAKRWMRTGKKEIKKMLEEIRHLEINSRIHWNKRLDEIGKLFLDGSKVKGVTFNWEGLDNFTSKLINVNKKLADAFVSISYLDLNFAKHSGNLQAASLSVTVFQKFLEEFQKQKTIVYEKERDFPMILVLVAVSVIFLLGCLFVFVIFSLTPYGRNKWRKMYLERYGSPETLELYWRYSYWIDQESEKNALCEAVREINYEQVKALVAKGAYINVYNSFGNTLLHAATKHGHAKIVEILLKNGADRNAYNWENKTPEQILEEGSVTITPSVNSSSIKEEKDRRVGAIEKLYGKYENKVMRKKLPDLLPTMSYHIRIDSRIQRRTVDIFTAKYKGLVTDQISGVTHLIVPTDKKGMLCSDEFSYIMCVFLPTMLMKEQWMRACLEKKSNLRDDYKWRVEAVRYKGRVYETVLKWSQWVHKQMLPFLFGVQLYCDCESSLDMSTVAQLRQLVEMHGATWCDELPVKEQYNIGSHPFHHFNLGPLWIIHGENKEKSYEHLKNDSDHMYTVMTFHNLVHFMLKMKTCYDPLRRPTIPLKATLTEIEDGTSIGPSTNQSSKKE